jgi:hypothetical protein
MDEKIYCGTGRIQTTSFGDMPKVKYHRDDVMKMLKYLDDNKTDWINVDMKKKQNVEEGKPTHYMQVDTWKPDGAGANAGNTPPPPTSDDMPF